MTARYQFEAQKEKSRDVILAKIEKTLISAGMNNHNAEETRQIASAVKGARP